MKITKTMSLCLGLVWGITGLVAQPSLGEKMRQEGIDWLIGDWVGQTDEGDTWRIRHERELNGHLVVTEAKGPSIAIKGMTSVDHDSNEVRYVGVTDTGGRATGTWEVEDGMPILRVTMHAPNGGSSRTAYTWTRVDQNTMELGVYEGRRAEDPTGAPDGTVTFKRQPKTDPVRRN
jgi:hypothetical protein